MYNITSNNNLIISTKIGMMKLLNCNNYKKKSIFCHFNKINCVSINGNFIASGGSDSTISISLESPYKNIFYMNSFCDSINCCYVSDVFSTAVFCANNGIIFLISLNEFLVTKTIELKNKKPLKVLVTKSWGFILIYSISKVDNVKYLSLFSINGELIKEKIVPIEISVFDSFTLNGFDYVLLASKCGQLYMFEAFFLNVEKEFFSTKKEIQTIAFDNEKLIMAVANDGTFFLFPIENTK